MHKDQIPFITDVRLVAPILARSPVVLSFIAETGDGARTVARSVAAIDDVEQLAHALLSIAAVARANAVGKPLPGDAPRCDVRLMHRITATPRHSIVGARSSQDQRVSVGASA